MATILIPVESISKLASVKISFNASIKHLNGADWIVFVRGRRIVDMSGLDCISSQTRENCGFSLAALGLLPGRYRRWQPLPPLCLLFEYGPENLPLSQTRLMRHALHLRRNDMRVYRVLTLTSLESIGKRLAQT
mgnify:CR=1 FL=1